MRLIAMIMLIKVVCGELNVNLAVGKSTWQVSTWTDWKYGVFDSDRANDGDTTGNFLDGLTCTATARGTLNPWWIMDLGRNYLVGRIAVYNRLDGMYQRLHNFTTAVADVMTSLTDFSRFRDCFRYTTIAGPGEVIDRECEKHLVGRFVKVQIFGSVWNEEVLTLCEVEVFEIYPLGLTCSSAEIRNEVEILASYMTSSVRECAVICRLNPICFSFNADVNGACELLVESLPSGKNLSNATEWTYNGRCQLR